MIVLKTNVDWLRKIGLYYSPNQNQIGLIDIIYNATWTLTTFLCMVGCISYSIVNIDDISKFSHGLYVTSGASMSVFLYWIMAFRKSGFRDLIDELQMIVSLSVYFRTSSVSLPLLFMLIFSFIQELLGPFSIPTKLLNENASCSHIICVCPYCSLWAMCLCAHFISPASNIFSAHTRAIRGSCHFRLCEFCHFQGLDNEKH